MRIILKSGKQKELILRAKENKTWGELANILDISTNYLLNELKNEERTLPEELYKKLIEITKTDYDTCIEQHRNDSWGQQKGGKLHKNNKKEAKILTKTKTAEVAEICGIISGDGNIYVDGGKGIYQLRICGNSETDRDYLLGFVTNQFKKLFGVELGSYYFKTRKELIVYKQSKDLIHTLKHFGLKEGNKKIVNSKIPSWIFSDKDLMKAFIRGLIDTDGSLCPKTPSHPYPSIWYSSVIPNLRKGFDEILERLDIHRSKWTESHAPQCCIGRSADVIKYYKEIGFNNPKHIKRFQKFAPVV